MALPAIPHCEVKAVTKWSNYHGTVNDAPLPVYCTPDVMEDMGPGAPRRMARHGLALRAIVKHCFDQQLSLRALGGRWSMSNLLLPADVTLDPANLNIVLKVRQDWLSAAYQQRQAQHQTTPVFVQGGTHIASLNRRLAQSGLALQTSGASDGHRIAGCIATGTHGSALGIGAVHDTVLAVHLMVAPDKCLLLQPKAAPFSADLALWLAAQTGIPTVDTPDDDLFQAARVGLGSLGLVQGVVVETVPLYRLVQRQESRVRDHTDVIQALTKLNTRAFHLPIGERPYHFQLVLHPYPTSQSQAAFATMYWKVPADNLHPTSPAPVEPELASDLMGLIASLSNTVDLPGSTELLRPFLDSQLADRYKPGHGHTGFPGEIFGPTSLPPGHGTSTEIVVALGQAKATIDLIYDVLASEASKGHHLLGAIGVRFVPQTQALLGMNVHPMNCYIELPSIRNDEVEKLYRLLWAAMDAKAINYTLHWGQRLSLTRARIDAYFGSRAARWVQARNTLLTPRAKAVFGAPLLAEVGLV